MKVNIEICSGSPFESWNDLALLCNLQLLSGEMFFWYFMKLFTVMDWQQIHCNPDQDKVLIEDELNEWMKERKKMFTVLLLNI